MHIFESDPNCLKAFPDYAFKATQMNNEVTEASYCAEWFIVIRMEKKSARTRT